MIFLQKEKGSNQKFPQGTAVQLDNEGHDPDREFGVSFRNTGNFQFPDGHPLNSPETYMAGEENSLSLFQKLTTMTYDDGDRSDVQSYYGFDDAADVDLMYSFPAANSNMKYSPNLLPPESSGLPGAFNEEADNGTRHQRGRYGLDPDVDANMVPLGQLPDDTSSESAQKALDGLPPVNRAKND